VSLGRIFVIATNVFRGGTRSHLVRHHLWHTARRCHPHTEVAATTEDKIFLDFGLAAMSLLGLIVAIFVGTGLVNKEIEKRTVLVLIAKPISRVYHGQTPGLSAVLALLVAAMTAIYLAMCTLENSLPLGSILLAALYLLIVINHSSRYWVGCIYQFSVSDAA